MNKTFRLPKAVLFDMDGVIVDSMPYHYIAWFEALRPYGVRVSCFDVFSREGERWDRSLDDFLGGAGIRVTSALREEIFACRQRTFKKYFKRFLFPGVESLIELLEESGYELGLVTGTPGEEVMRILPAALRKRFKCIVTGDMTARGKPHLEPYLRAAKILEVETKDCWVIENAPLGIESARRAGMICIAVDTSLPATYLRRAHAVVSSFGDISRRLCGKRSNRR
jgi:beta-phosphoglucomutase